MQFFYENQNSNSFLVYQLEETDKLDSFNYGMIANNKINGIIPANLTQINTDKFLKYNVSSTVTLKQYFEGIVNKKRIVNVFLSIVSAMLEAEDYMIDSTMFVLDTDYIFVDVSSAKASIISFPIVSYHTAMKPLEFFKSIIFTIQYDRTENADYVAEIITYLNSGDQFSLQGFKRLLLSFNSAAAKVVQTKPNVVTNVQNKPPKPAPPVKQVQPAPKPTPQQMPVKQVPVQNVQIQTPPPAKSAPAGSPTIAPKPASVGRSGAGFEIPGGGKMQSAPQQSAAVNAGGEKRMSLMHLLRNYSKENLEIYKQQKNAEQAAAQSQPQPQPAKPAKAEKRARKRNDSAPKGNPVAGFEIPGSSQVPPQANVQAPPISTPQPAPAVNTPAPQNPPVSAMQQAYTPAPQQPALTRDAAFGTTQGNFGATTTLGVGGSVGTTVLGASPVAGNNQKPVLNPRLIRSKNNENIPVNKPVFRIGKEHSYVDYFVPDNSAISRSHANIVTRGEQFFIVDTNSTNHTYVNGLMIQSNQESEIHDKDIIRLANEDFEFRIY